MTLSAHLLAAALVALTGDVAPTPQAPEPEIAVDHGPHELQLSVPDTPTAPPSLAERPAREEAKPARRSACPLIARYYWPELGRWVSADPLFVGAPEEAGADPLQLNSFAFVLGNPYRFIDPIGLSVWIDSDNTVVAVIDDSDTGVYRVTQGKIDLVGELLPPSEPDPPEVLEGQRQAARDYQRSREAAVERGEAKYHSQEETESMLHGAAEKYRSGEEDLLDADENVSGRREGGGGKYDFKNRTPGSYYHTEHGVLEESQFGNYHAGYANTAGFGDLGEAATRAGGHLFSVLETGHPDATSSTEMIDKGVADARRDYPDASQ